MRTRMTRDVLSLALTMMSIGEADAATWHVNVDGTGDAPTIQAAINAASSGDEVLVHPGLYTWTTQGGDSTQFYGSSMLVLRDGIFVRGLAGPESTIVDAEGRGRVVLGYAMQSGGVAGVTIRGGHTTDPNGIPEADLKGQGGGVLCRGSTLTIENCVIVDNVAQHEAGGIAVYESSPTILSNVITRNLASSTAGIRVGGNLSHPEIRSNTIARNFGTAIVVFSATATIRQNVIAENMPSYLPGTGSGLGCYFANTTVECNNFWMNAEPNDGCVDSMGISEDPLFCATSSVFDLRPGSPCLPENNACGVLMGASDMGCTVTDARGGGDVFAFAVGSGGTSFSFTLPRPDRITLSVFDVRGRWITDVASSNLPAGTHRVPGVRDRRRLPSGIYFARLTTIRSGEAALRFLHVR